MIESFFVFFFAGNETVEKYSVFFWLLNFKNAFHVHFLLDGVDVLTLSVINIL